MDAAEAFTCRLAGQSREAWVGSRAGAVTTNLVWLVDLGDSK
jgi:hypothetical protein